MSLMPYRVCWKKKPPSDPVKFFWLQCLIYYVCKYGYKNSKKATSKTKCCHGQTEKWLFMLE